MVNIWNRFQYTYMFLYALLPFGLYLFVRGLKEKKYNYAFLLNLTSLGFVMAFTSIPLLELFWIVLGAYLLFYIAVNWPDKKAVFFSVRFFFLCLSFWFLFNAWWVLPFLKTLLTTAYITTEAYTILSNIGTFQALSERLGNLSFLFRLMHKDFFYNMKEVWGPIYFSPPFVILSFLIPFLAFSSVFVKKKPKEYFFFLLLAVLGIFFAKGSTPPLGGIFLWFFSRLRPLEAFRNPFEKIGLILPLAYAPLIGLSLTNFYGWLKKKTTILRANFLFSVSCFLLFIVYMFPMWNGWVFTSNIPPANNLKIGYKVKVPDYYKEANEWLNREKEDFRIIALPIGGEGITYNWEYGYSGVELSNNLFDKPFISLSTTIPYLHGIVSQLEKTLLTQPTDFASYSALLNTKYVIVRDDIDFRERKMRNSQDFNEFLLSNKDIGVSFVKNFGKLNFYKLSEEFFLPRIYPAQSVHYFSGEDGSYVELFSLSGFKRDDIFLNKINKENSREWEFANLIVNNFYISPETAIFLEKTPRVSRENAARELPSVRILPNSSFFPLILFKEKLEETNLQGEEKLRFNVSLSSKRLREAFLLAENGEEEQVVQALKRYQRFLNRAFDQLGVLEKRQLLKMFDDLRDEFLRQRIVLEQIKERVLESKVATIEALRNLEEIVTRLELEPIFPLLEEKELKKEKRIVYRFFAPDDDHYKILVKVQGWKQYYQEISKSWTIQVDNEVKTREIEFVKSGWISLGEVRLDEGIHEISFNSPHTINLINLKQTESFEISAKEATNELRIPISNFDPFSSYKVSFEYKVERGDSPEVGMLTDLDNLEEEKKASHLIKLPWGDYNFGFRNYEFEFTPSTGANSLDLVLLVSPWNNCRLVNRGLRKMLCEDEKYKRIYDRESVVFIKNIKVERVFTNTVILEQKNEKRLLQKVSPLVTFNKINPTKYRVKVEGAESPYFLVFSESFHPEWRAYLDKDQIPDDKHFLVNGYANAWYIDKSGDYEITLEFGIERIFKAGKLISITFLILLGGIFLVRRYV